MAGPGEDNQEEWTDENGMEVDNTDTDADAVNEEYSDDSDDSESER